MDRLHVNCLALRDHLPSAEYALRQRLWNWGRYARQGMGGPDSSCANPLYQMMVHDPNDEGYGDITVDTVIVQQEHAARPELEEIDEEDGESLDVVIRSRAYEKAHRAILVLRFQMGVPCKTQEAKNRLQRAVFELGRLV